MVWLFVIAIAIAVLNVRVQPIYCAGSFDSTGAVRGL